MIHQETDAATVIAIDAMGGDRGPATVVLGLVKALKAAPDLRFLIHGDEAVLRPLVARRPQLAANAEIRHAPRVVAMTDKPGVALRAAEGTSMWAALGDVAEGAARATVSCGNTGALMAMSMLRLKKAAGVDRPAIAVFWPSRTAAGFTIVLDVGADLRAEPHDLVQFAVMGAEYARIGLKIEAPRVGLLNVGAEETKGRPDLRAARDLLEASAATGGYRWCGFVEGGDISGDRADVIVTDGFTGNIALKTAEGTAAFIGEQLRASFRHNWLSQLVGLLAMTTLARMRRRIDPRRANGGVFLGLRGAVVKSHGGADATGVAAAVRLAARMGRTGFADLVANRVAALAHTERGTAQS